MHYKCIVILPVGPNHLLDHVMDTVASVARYMPDALTVVVDNSTAGIPATVYGSLPVVAVRKPNTGFNTLGTLYRNWSDTLQWIAATYTFDVILRLDDDALVIGAGADDQAIAMFRRHPDIGCLGSFRATCTGGTRDFAPAASALARDMRWRGIVLRPRQWWFLRTLVRRARRNGYQAGEHALGAAMFLSPACVARLIEMKLLANAVLAATSMADDQIFGILVRAAGFATADFATDGLPLGLAWRGLPASAATLIGMGKKIVHSVKTHDGVTQDAIRAEFRSLLQAGGHAGAAAARG